MKKIIYLTFLLSFLFCSSAIAAESNTIKLVKPDMSKPIAETVQPLNSSEFVNLLIANKGKHILINFFATWCGPCLNEIPDLIKVREKYSEDELLIIGLSLDSSMADLEKYLKASPINYPVFIPADNLIAAYRVYSIPHNIVYNKEGKTVYNTSGTLTESLIDRILTQ